MEDTGILEHLLEIEAQAASLVDEAQAEADRRIKAAEEQNRLSFDEAYRNLVTELEAEYRKAEEAVRAECGASLDEYRRSLEGIFRDQEAFSGLARMLLLGER